MFWNVSYPKVMFTEFTAQLEMVILLEIVILDCELP